MRLYHNPRCSKSRQALALIELRNSEFEEYRYLEKGVSQDDLETLVQLEGVIRANDLDSDCEFNLNSKTDLRKLLESNSKVLQRPILVHDGKAVIGRPPEEILTLLLDA